MIDTVASFEVAATKCVKLTQKCKKLEAHVVFWIILA
jgi:hypothetical protein